MHRIGQTKETFVWRYIISNTVEETLVSVIDNHELAPKLESKDKGEHFAEETLNQIFQFIENDRGSEMLEA